MSVYIEYVIIDNFIIDYILLYAVSVSMRLKRNKYMLALSAALGTAAAVVLPLLSVADILSVLIKFFTAAFMVAMISRKGFKFYVISLILFFTYSFALGGCVIGVLMLLCADIYYAASLNYSLDFPVGVILGACFVYTLLIIKLAKYIEKKRHIYPFIREVCLFYKGRQIKTCGYIDSGNRMYDENGEPVILISSYLAGKIIPQETLLKLYAGLYSGKDFVKKKIVTAFNQKSYMYLFKIVKLLIYFKDEVNTIENVSVAAALTGFKEIEGCQVLLHADLIN